MPPCGVEARAGGVRPGGIDVARGGSDRLHAAAIHRDRLPIDIGRRRRAQEGDHAGDLGGLGEASTGTLASIALAISSPPACRTPRWSARICSMRWVSGVARQHVVHRDAVAGSSRDSVLASRPPRPDHCGHARVGDRLVHRGRDHVDDAAPAGRASSTTAWSRWLATRCLLKASGRHRCRPRARTAGRSAGVVDQDVHRRVGRQCGDGASSRRPARHRRPIVRLATCGVGRSASAARRTSARASTVTRAPSDRARPRSRARCLQAPHTRACFPRVRSIIVPQGWGGVHARGDRAGVGIVAGSQWRSTARRLASGWFCSTCARSPIRAGSAETDDAAQHGALSRVVGSDSQSLPTVASKCRLAGAPPGRPGPPHPRKVASVPCRCATS